MEFKSAKELLTLCKEHDMPISAVMRTRECTLGETDEAGVDARMARAWDIMRTSAHEPLTTPLRSMGGLIGGESRKLRTGRWGVRSFGLRKFAVFADRGLHDKGVPPLHRGLLFRNRGKYSISACRGGADVRSSPLQSAPIGF